MNTCRNCGIGFTNSSGLVECFKYKSVHSGNDNMEACNYHMDIQYEDGEAMTPLQHLLLKEQELKNRHMKGMI